MILAVIHYYNVSDADDFQHIGVTFQDSINGLYTVAIEDMTLITVHHKYKNNLSLKYDAERKDRICTICSVNDIGGGAGWGGGGGGGPEFGIQ